MNIHVHIHTYKHTYTHAHARIRTWGKPCKPSRLCAYEHMYASTSTCMCVYIGAPAHASTAPSPGCRHLRGLQAAVCLCPRGPCRRPSGGRSPRAASSTLPVRGTRAGACVRAHVCVHTCPYTCMESALALFMCEYVCVCVCVCVCIRMYMHICIAPTLLHTCTCICIDTSCHICI